MGERSPSNRPIDEQSSKEARRECLENLSPSIKQQSKEMVSTDRRTYLKTAAAAVAGAGGIIGASGSVSAASRELINEFESGESTGPQSMEVNLYLCGGGGASEDDRINAMRDGLSTVEAECGPWFDGWKLEAYRTDLEIDNGEGQLPQMASFLTDIGVNRKANHHFVHGRLGSQRNGVTAWGHNDRLSISSYSTWNDIGAPAPDVTLFHQNLHNFINMEIEDVREMAEGEDNYERKHSLGSVDTSAGNARTIMADRYEDAATEKGACSVTGDTDGATMSLSQCTRYALLHSSLHPP